MKSKDKIVELILNNSFISASEISLNIGISVPTVEKHLKQLKKMGNLKRLGSPNVGYWEVLL